MKELETLLNRRWILKSEDRELYYKIRDSIGEIRKFATEKMGCQVIENALRRSRRCRRHAWELTRLPRGKSMPSCVSC